MKPDIIVTWPRSMDYPVWRGFIKANRERFGEVFVAFMESNRKEDFSAFVKEAMKDDAITFVEDYIVTGDWRNSAVNACLARSKSEWVWFTEQDFFVFNHDAFFFKMKELTFKNDAIFYKEGERIHPACMFVRRAAIDQTRKDFGIVPNVSDHFSIFVANLQANKVREAYVSNGSEGYQVLHLNGLTHNYHLVMDHAPENIYNPGAFLLYNSYARTQRVPQDERFMQLTYVADFLLTPYAKFFAAK